MSHGEDSKATEALERAKADFRLKHFRKKSKRKKDSWEAKDRPNGAMYRYEYKLMKDDKDGS
jgi:hypothetical protein